MKKIDRLELGIEDIICSAEFESLLDSLTNSNDPFSILRKVRLGRDDPPVFLYQESRGKGNFVSCYTFYGGKGDRAQAGIGSRKELNLGQRFSDSDRGTVLAFFSQIEFCLEVLVCITQGVFDGKVSYKRIRNQFDDENGSFSTTQRKINYLKDFRVITPHTADLLKKSRHVRNVLGHQYMPDNDVGLKAEEIALYESTGEAVSNIYNAAWLNLISDYVKQQDQVAKWLVGRLEGGGVGERAPDVPAGD
ncbi:MAG TPA: hypothetical protein VLG27_04785 [Candidatus Saccharimonadia bacterium]|nr:hypothetical protein [Candidatus Saccharimonadia bacterium]